MDDSRSQKVFEAQKEQWENSFANKTDMFGAASSAARNAATLFKKENRKKVLELGAGQGRDTIFLAQKGFEIYALDYAESGLRAIKRKVQELSLHQSIKLIHHDVRNPLPFSDETFDSCYSHMLFCMALTTTELESLSREIWRVLRPGGLNIYTVRHTNDPDYRNGIHKGEDMYESGGFTVHYFSREKVDHLAKGYDIVDVDEFEEGRLPRKLFRVTLRKKAKFSG